MEARLFMHTVMIEDDARLAARLSTGLSADGHAVDRGADDEAARIDDAVLAVGEVRLDPASRRVWRGGDQIDLPDKQFRLLEYMLQQPGRVLTRTMIAENVWDDGLRNVTNVIDVHILQLRRKLGDPYPGVLIQTVRGAGYRLKVTA